MAKRVKRRSKSRLARTEGKKLMRQTWMLIAITIVSMVAIFKWGVPAIINMAVFLGDINSSSQPIGQEDTLAPTPPILSSLPIATTSGMLSITGYTEADSTVKLFRSGEELSETVTDESGDFLFTDIELLEDENSFYAVAYDGAENESEQSNRVSIIFDTEAPELMVDSPDDGSEYYGEAKRTVTVSGTTDSGAEVKVNDYHAVVSASGSFSTRLRLEEGENTIKVVAVDDAGNETEASLTVRYTP